MELIDLAEAAFCTTSRVKIVFIIATAEMATVNDFIQATAFFDDWIEVMDIEPALIQANHSVPFRPVFGAAKAAGVKITLPEDFANDGKLQLELIGHERPLQPSHRRS